MNKDIKGFYAILGLQSNATQDEIKKQYRNMAKKHHPDREEGSEEEFKKIQEAYDTLSNETKRDLYDRNIDADDIGHGDFGGVHMNMFDLGDILKNVFTENVDFFQTNQSPRFGNAKIPKHTVNVELNLDDVVFGCTKTVMYDHTIKCKKCDENGMTHTGLIHCITCSGQGYLPTFPFPTQCHSCGGESVIRQNLQKCQSCDAGYTSEKLEVEIKLNPATTHNQKIEVTSDLDIVLKHRFHLKDIKIKGSDIYLRTTIKIEEAILGFKKTIRLTDSESVITLRSEQYFDTSESWTIKNRGVYVNENKRGNLIVNFAIEGSDYGKNIIKFRKAFEKIFA